MKITLPITALAAILGLALAGVPVSAQAQTPATTTPATTTSAAAPAAPAKPKPTRFAGALTAVDTTANTITITDKTKAPRTFTITATTKITKDKKPATLADFAVGDKVGGSYTTDASGTMTATTLSYRTPMAPKAKASATGTATVTTPAAPATPAAQ